MKKSAVRVLYNSRSWVSAYDHSRCDLPTASLLHSSAIVLGVEQVGRSEPLTCLSISSSPLLLLRVTALLGGWVESMTLRVHRVSAVARRIAWLSILWSLIIGSTVGIHGLGTSWLGWIGRHSLIGSFFDFVWLRGVVRRFFRPMGDRVELISQLLRVLGRSTAEHVLSEIMSWDACHVVGCLPRGNSHTLICNLHHIITRPWRTVDSTRILREYAFNIGETGTWCLSLMLMCSLIHNQGSGHLFPLVFIEGCLK